MRPPLPRDELRRRTLYTHFTLKAILDSRQEIISAIKSGTPRMKLSQRIKIHAVLSNKIV